MFTIAFLLLWASSSFLYYYFISKSIYLIALWIISGFFSSIILMFVLLFLLVPIMKYTKPNTKFKYLFLRSLSRFLNSHFLGLKVTADGVGNIPKTGRVTVYANHKSKEDPFLVMAHMNRAMAFTPKISIYKLPLVNVYLNYLGCLPIDRNDNRRTAKTLIKAIDNVKNDLAMLIFPEGGILTRETQKMVGVKPGAYKIGMKAESDFLPVSIINNHKIAKKKRFSKLHVKLVFHPVVKYEEIKNLSTQEIGEKMMNIINSKL